MYIAELLLGFFNAFHVADLDGGQNRSGLERAGWNESVDTEVSMSEKYTGYRGQPRVIITAYWGMRSLENLENQQWEAGGVSVALVEESG